MKTNNILWLVLQNGSVTLAIIFLFMFSSYAQQPRWAFSVGGTGTEYLYPMIVDNGGDIIVAGQFEGTGVDFDPGPGEFLLSSKGYYDLFVAKYTVEGDFVWAFSVGDELSEACYGMDNDDQGNIYITGYFSSSSADFDPGQGTAALSLGNGSSAGFVASYDNSGNYRWAFAIPCLGTNGMISGYTVEVDIHSDVLVTGYFQGEDVAFDPEGTANVTSNNYSQDIFLAKYTSSGTYKWVNTPGGTDHDFGEFVSSDPLGNHYFCGYFISSSVDFEPGPGEYILTTAGGADAFLVKYNTDGHVIWGFALGSAQQDAAFGIAIDSDTSVYINGSYGGTVDFDPGQGVTNLTALGYRDAFFAKYTSNGEMVYAKSVGSIQEDNSQAITVDGDHNLYITGYFMNGENDFDPGPSTFTLPYMSNSDLFWGKYDENGDLGWVASVNSTGSVNSYRLLCLPDGDVLLSGVFSGNEVDFDPGESTLILNGHGYSYDIFLARYAQTPFGIWERNMTGGLSAWPNPVKEQIHISLDGYSKSQILHAILKDLQGRTLLNVIGSLENIQDKMNAQMGSLGNGMYILVLKDGDKVMVKKFIRHE